MKTKSKYGPLKKGDIREDGYVFWAYQQGGNELWYAPDRFLVKDAKLSAYNELHSKKHAKKKAEAMHNWRLRNKGRSAIHKAEDNQRKRIAKRWVTALGHYRELIARLESPALMRNWHDPESTGEFIRFHTTARRAKMLSKFLTAHINEKQFVPV